MFSERSSKVATPPEAFRVFVPDRVALPGLLSSATVTEALLPVTRLSFASRTRTVTDGESVWPALVEAGGWMPNATFVAVPAAYVTDADPLKAEPSSCPVTLTFCATVDDVSVAV